MAAIMKTLEQVNTDLQEQKEKVDDVDFKMITFSLAGKDYGVDIMNVKEIAKADKFTFVPNAASFIRGVYNLRGDIIPVIDLRTFFHQPLEKKPDGVENLLILHINDQVYGTIVDKIDKVIGINHEAIQPPHPIFGDINIKFIKGVVEKQGDLYIILDVIRIFTVSEEDKNKARGTVATTDSGEYYISPPGETQAQMQKSAADSAIGFIQESLAALRRFTVTRVNERWLHRRFAEWSSGRSGDNVQLRSASEADEFLESFLSPYTGEFWSESYAATVRKILPEYTSTSINVWNIGCSKGYETYSFACILKSKYPNARIKIWANDNDIMSVSQAPNMVYELDEIPEYCRSYMVHGPNGYSFSPVIKDSIVFEYHDIMHENSLPELDIILARDVISYLPQQEQKRIIEGFTECLKNHGVVIMGRNEELAGSEWHPVADDPISAFMYSV